MNTQEIQEWEKELKGIYTFRFEFDNKKGERMFKVCSWNDGMSKEEAFKNVLRYINEFENSKLTDFIENDYLKSFISQKLKEQEERHKREMSKELEIVMEYVERVEEQIEGEWGKCRPIDELIKKGQLPSFYYRIKDYLKHTK